MKEMKSVIIAILIAIPLLKSFPVTSRALNNNSDQLIWQTAWYSRHLSPEKESPFNIGGDGKKITAKSIFITPNFSQNTSVCPPGHKIDENGKCLKFFVVNINTDDVLVTRLQSVFSKHQTTDDTTNIDYDYSIDVEDSNEPIHYALPLVPIINNNETATLYTVSENFVVTTQRVEIDENQVSFYDPSHQDYQETSTKNQRVDNLNSTQVHHDITKSSKTEGTNFENGTAWYNESESPRADESDMNTDQNDTTTIENLSLYEELTEPVTQASMDSQDQFTDDGEYEYNYTTELVIHKFTEETDETIRNGSDTAATHLDDYFEAMIANDSLLIDDSLSFENATDVDYDFTTEIISKVPQPPNSNRISLAIESFNQINIATVTTENSSQEFTPYINVLPDEARTIHAEEQNNDLENGEAENKFIYHHFSATERFSDSLPTPSQAFVRFPETDSHRRMRFPDESRGPSVSWPDDNGGLMRFWKDQPLINDHKIFSRGHSATGSIVEYFHRRQKPYRKNF